MGNIFSYIADSITNRGALDAVTAKDKESLEALAFQNAGFGNMPTYTPPEGNVIAQQFAQQTMNPLPRTMTTVPPEMGLGAPTQQLGPQTYQDPRALMREYYADLIDGKRARETARAQEQLSDPMFRFRDTMTDVARNTIGLPFHILSGGQAFNNDPSREAQSRHEARLEELDKLNGANSELYQGAKEQRFADLMNLENQRKVSETNRINAVGQNRLFKSNNPDFYTVESQAAAQRLAEQGAALSEQRAALVVKDDFREIKDRNGRVALYNKTTGEFVGYKFDFNDELKQQEQIATSRNFTKAQGVYHADRPRMQRTIRTFASKRDAIEREVNAVLELLDGKTQAIGGVLQYIPGTDRKTIEGKIQMLVANIGFAEIQKMREQSKSGGALGQVTEKELAFLQAVLGRLSQFDDPQVLRDNLGIVLQEYDNSVSSLEYNLSEMDGLYGTSATNRRIFNPNIAYDGNTAFEALLADPKPEDFPSNNADTQNGSLAEQPQPNSTAPALSPEEAEELAVLQARQAEREAERRRGN